MDKKITTVAIYREDLKDLADMCKKNENFRDKLHEIILKTKNEGKLNGNKRV
jgi:hypothetical protein